MKRFIITVLILLASIGATAKNTCKGVNLDRLNDLITDYRNCEGFDVINIGGLGTLGIKALIKHRIETEYGKNGQSIYNIIRDIKKFAVVDYDNCENAVKSEFDRKVNRMLTDDNLIMEVKGFGEVMKIYGVADENNNRLRNFVMYAPSEGALICMFGSIPLSSINSLIQLQ